MIDKKYLKIYSIKHTAFNEPELVLADSLNDAIEKFNRYYMNDYNVMPDDIEDVHLIYNKEVIYET